MFSALNHSSTSSIVWLNEMTLRLEEMEVRMKNNRDTSEMEKNFIIINGNVGSKGSVSGENI